MKTETGDQFGRPGAAMPFALPDAMLNAVISRSVWPPPARSDWPPFDTCGGRLRVLDVVLRADVIDKILDHLNRPTVRYHLESSRPFIDAA